MSDLVSIEAVNLTKSFAPGQVAVSGLDLRIAPERFMVWWVVMGQVSPPRFDS